jgi:hypothetical protein
MIFDRRSSARPTAICFLWARRGAWGPRGLFAFFGFIRGKGRFASLGDRFLGLTALEEFLKGCFVPELFDFVFYVPELFDSGFFDSGYFVPRFGRVIEVDRLRLNERKLEQKFGRDLVSPGLFGDSGRGPHIRFLTPTLSQRERGRMADFGMAALC